MSTDKLIIDRLNQKRYESWRLRNAYIKVFPGRKLPQLIIRKGA